MVIPTLGVLENDLEKVIDFVKSPLPCEPDKVPVCNSTLFLKGFTVSAPPTQ